MILQILSVFENFAAQNIFKNKIKKQSPYFPRFSIFFEPNSYNLCHRWRALFYPDLTDSPHSNVLINNNNKQMEKFYRKTLAQLRKQRQTNWDDRNTQADGTSLSITALTNL